MRVDSLTLLSFSCCLLLFLSGCVSHEQLRNYQGELPDEKHIVINNPPEIRIQPNDVLSIKVHSTDLETSAPFNLTPVDAANNFSGIEALQLTGYLVDEEGKIDFPVLGAIKLDSLTISEAKEFIKEKLKKLLKDPVVNIRLLNFTVTVTGEVNTPGAFTIINERISLPDALALAGDLTGHASRNNILLVREKNGIRSLNRIDMMSIDFFNSEFFYLKQNDMIYVEPLKARTGSVEDQTSKLVPIVGVTVSFVAVVIALLNNNGGN